MRVLALHHAGVYVSNLARSVRFYGDVFGLQVVEQLTLAGEEIAFLGVGTARLELIEAPADPRSRTAGVVDHVALEVEQLEALVQRLRDRGVTLIDAAPVAVPELRARILFCLGPDAERIELLEREVPREPG